MILHIYKWVNTVSLGRLHRHTHLTINALALYTHTHAHTCPYTLLTPGCRMDGGLSLIFINSFKLIIHIISILSGYNKSFEAAFFISASYNLTPILTYIRWVQGKTPAQIPAVVYPPGQASWVGKVPLSIWNCPLPAEQKGQLANSAPVSPPSNFGGKLFGSSLAAGWTSLVTRASSKISSPCCVFICKFSFILSHALLDFTYAKLNI